MCFLVLVFVFLVGCLNECLSLFVYYFFIVFVRFLGFEEGRQEGKEEGLGEEVDAQSRPHGPPPRWYPEAYLSVLLRFMRVATRCAL